MGNWAREEVKTADLGDLRLNGRFAVLLEQLGRKPQVSIPAACGGWTETMAAYRFFGNEKTTFEQILKPHAQSTLERMRLAPVVLLVQDTTEDDETVTLGPKGLGTIKETQKHQCRLHPTIAFTPEKICLGVLAADYWRRGGKSDRKARRGKGADEKESRRWLDSYQHSCALQGQLPGSLLVNVADREGDIYEWFADYHEHGAACRAQFIVRAAQDRLLAGSAENHPKLWGTLGGAPALGAVDVDVKARPGRKARVAKLTLRSASVVLKPPSRNGHRLEEARVNAVLAREESPPDGVEGLEWLLLTSLPAASFEQAATVMAWYAVRWCIEVYFHVLKSGCQIEGLQLGSEDRYLPCLALYMIIAWRVLFTLMLGRNCPDMDCGAVFEQEEWQALYLVVKRSPPPEEAPPLGDAVLMVARLGGHLNRKHDSPPGPKALWTGLQRLRDFVVALAAQRAAYETCV